MMPQHMPQWFAKARKICAGFNFPRPVAKAGEPVNVYIYDAIGFDPWSGSGVEPKDIAKQLDDAKGAPLAIHMNSPGGYVFDGLAIYNLIRTYAGEKIVYVDGLAASIASIVALAGDRVVTNDGAEWMVHDPMGGMMVWGTADDIEEAARKEVGALRKARENLLAVYTENTGRSPAEVSGWMTDETWMTATESLERGFSDEVVPVEAAEPAAARAAPPLPPPPAARVIPINAFASLRRDAIVAARKRAAARGASPAIGGTK